MSYRLPPLNGLRAFEASARHLSFKRAADELCVTPGAVSQQVKSLEESLGVPLFRRLPRGLLLTAGGENYLPSISKAFHAISEATESVSPALKGRKLRVGVSPTLSGQSHPAIENYRRIKCGACQKRRHARDHWVELVRSVCIGGQGK